MSVHSPVLSSHIIQLNYKADGSPFWNQFFVAALRDSEGGVVNYVGVQCEVNTLPIEGIKDRYVSQSVSPWFMRRKTNCVYLCSMYVMTCLTMSV